ncbi:cyclin-like protein interacting with PHO85 [Savitreella phatthalungensis]
MDIPGDPPEKDRADLPSLDIATFPQNELLVMLAALLTKITTANDRLNTSNNGSNYTPKAGSPLLAFHARNIPSISIQAYLMRILKYCPMSSDIFLCLLVYFDRLSRASTTHFAVDSFNVHRLVIAGIVVASKFCSDVFYTNSRYAKVGGLPLAELNHLEFQFLLMNDFRLLVPLEDLQRYADQLLLFWGAEGTPTRIEAKSGAVHTEDE